jgi:hypothetical protein
VGFHVGVRLDFVRRTVGYPMSQSESGQTVSHMQPAVEIVMMKYLSHGLSDIDDVILAASTG